MFIFLWKAPPWYSPSQIVQIMKSISVNVMFSEFLRVEQHVWGVSNGMMDISLTSEVICRYIKYQQQEQLVFDFYCLEALLRGNLFRQPSRRRDS